MRLRKIQNTLKTDNDRQRRQRRERRHRREEKKQYRCIYNCIIIDNILCNQTLLGEEVCGRDASI